MKTIQKYFILSALILSMHTPKIQADATTAIVGGLTIGVASGVAYDRSGLRFPLGWLAETIVRNLVVGAVTSQASAEDKFTVHAAAEAASWLTFLALYKDEPRTINIIMGTEKIPLNSLQQYKQLS